VYSTIKTILDRLYTAGGVLGALFLIAILCLIVVQMLARWFGWNVELIKGAPDYAGYCMAAASFLSFAYALNRGAHIRVSRWSHKLNDISQGQDATPLWVPQLAMCVGAVLLAICFWDNLVRLFVDREHAIKTETVREH